MGMRQPEHDKGQRPDDVPTRQRNPARLKYTLEEALDLLAALEEAAEALRSTDPPCRTLPGRHRRPSC